MPKRVTVKQIADDLGISVMTVSRALNSRPNVDDKTKERVVNAAMRLGYIPNLIAKSLVEKKTYTIGVVVPEITHSFFPEVIRGIEEVAHSHKYQLILTHTAENAERETAALKTLASKRVDGILISTAESMKGTEIYKQMQNIGLPIVFFDRCVYNIGASCVGIDDENSAKRITEHLIEQGYKRIAHLSGPLSVSIGKARYNGFKLALKKHNIPLDKNLVMEAGFHEMGGYVAMKKLLLLPPEELPEAVVAVNDPCAFGAMQAILDHGFKLPDDIAIVGFSDDIRAELMSTPLTTVRQPAYEVGKAAAKKLLAHIDNKNEKPENITINTELIIRESSVRQHKEY
jgi:DNA-binding LacI/PurR family transcriptional regulator